MKFIDLAYTPNGSISFPKYPSIHGSNQDCKWRISAPQGQKVLIYFSYLGMEDCCECDYVKIFDGHNEYGSLLTKACNGSFPDPVYSSGRYIYVKVHSDGDVEGGGFAAHYRVLNGASGKKGQERPR